MISACCQSGFRHLITINCNERRRLTTEYGSYGMGVQCTDTPGKPATGTMQATMPYERQRRLPSVALIDTGSLATRRHEGMTG